MHEVRVAVTEEARGHPAPPLSDSLLEHCLAFRRGDSLLRPPRYQKDDDRLPGTNLLAITRNSSGCTRALIAFLLTWITIFSLACGDEDSFGRSPTASIVSLVPADISYLGSARVQDIVDDEQVGEIYAKIPPRYRPGVVIRGATGNTFAEAVRRYGLRFGVAPEHFSRLLFFSDIRSQQSYIGVILQGDFDGEELFDSIADARPAPITKIRHQGHDIVLLGPVEAIARFDGIMIWGTLDAVKDVIDVRAAAKSPISGSMLEAFEGLGDPYFKLVARNSPELLRSLPLSVLPDQLGLVPVIGEINTLAWGFDRSETGFAHHVELGFDNALASRVASSILRAFKALITLVPVQEFSTLIDKTDVTTNGSSVVLDLDITVDEFQRVFEEASIIGPILDGFPLLGSRPPSTAPGGEKDVDPA